MRKASFEEIQATDGSSFFMGHNKAPMICHQDFWHFHPGFELVYIPRGKGRRFVGHKISRFDEGDLVMMGPNIPHNAFNFGFESAGYEEYVIQFHGDQIEEMANNFPEFSAIAKLLVKARTGISVPGEAKHRVGKLVTGLFDLTPFHRLIQLFLILREISLLSDIEDLQAGNFLSISATQITRIQQVYELIQKGYRDDLPTRQVAERLAMTESSFCRFFKSITGKSFKQALTEIRIQKACDLLIHSDLSVGSIASQSGFNNISLFNRLFKEIIHVTPNSYRRSQGVTYQTERLAPLTRGRT